VAQLRARRSASSTARAIAPRHHRPTIDAINRKNIYFSVKNFYGGITRRARAPSKIFVRNRREECSTRSVRAGRSHKAAREDFPRVLRPDSAPSRWPAMLPVRQLKLNLNEQLIAIKAANWLAGPDSSSQFHASRGLGNGSAGSVNMRQSLRVVSAQTARDKHRASSLEPSTSHRRLYDCLRVSRLSLTHAPQSRLEPVSRARFSRLHHRHRIGTASGGS
jgi:hypothetical protein